MKGDGFRHRRRKASGVSAASVRTWASAAGRATAWWAEISPQTAQSHLGGRPASQSQCPHSGSHLHPSLPLLHCPVGRDEHKCVGTSVQLFPELVKMLVSFTCGEPAGVLSTDAEERLFLWTKSCFLLFLLRPLLFTPPSRLV